jgi:hypothetical protein
MFTKRVPACMLLLYICLHYVVLDGSVVYCTKEPTWIDGFSVLVLVEGLVEAPPAYTNNMESISSLE